MGVIRKHLIAFVISLIFWSFVSGPGAIESYHISMAMGDPIKANAGGVGSLVGLFILALIFTAIWAGIRRILAGLWNVLMPGENEISED